MGGGGAPSGLVAGENGAWAASLLMPPPSCWPGLQPFQGSTGEGSASELMRVIVGWPLPLTMCPHMAGGCLSVPTWQVPSISAGQPFSMASSRVSDERQKVWGETEPPHGNCS